MKTMKRTSHVEECVELPRRNSIVTGKELVNPKPLVESSDLPRRRHSIGCYEDVVCMRSLRSEISWMSIDRRVKLDKVENEKISIVNEHNSDDTTDSESDKALISSRGCSVPLWRKHENHYAKGVRVENQLHEEIVQFAEYTTAIVDEMAVDIEATIENVRQSVKQLWKDAIVETFGSYSTGFWLPSSDVDLVILGAEKRNENATTLSKLKRLANVLQHEAWVHTILVVDSAKVPVIKIVSADTHVPIDITFESTSTHSGILARDLIIDFKLQMPQIYPLAIVLKQMLRERGLNEAYKGGISSYSTLLLIIHFIQLRQAGPDAFRNALVYASGGNPEICKPVVVEPVAEPPIKVVQEVKAAAKVPTVMSYAAVATMQKVLKKAEPPVMSYAMVASRKPGSNQLRTTTISKTATNVKSKSNLKLIDSKVVAKTQPVRQHEKKSVATTDSDADDCSSCSSSNSMLPDEQKYKCNLGVVFIELLEFFGTIIDYRISGMSVRNGGYIFRLPQSSSKIANPLALVIEDPIYQSHNVGACTFAMPKIIAAFEDAYYALKYYRYTRFIPTALSCILHPLGHGAPENRSNYE